MKNIFLALLALLSFSLAFGPTRVSRLQLSPKIAISAVLSGDNNDFNPTGWDNAEIVNLSTSPFIVPAITGFDAPTAGYENEKVLVNTGDYPIVISPGHTGSVAANRVIGTNEFILFPKRSVRIHYNTTSSRWFVSGGTFSMADFIGAPRASLFSTELTSLTAGDNPVFVTGGTGSITAQQASSTQPGFINFTTGSSSTAGLYATFGKSFTSLSVFGSSYMCFRARVWTVNLSTPSERYTINFRITSAPTTLADNTNNSVGIRYSDNIASGAWQCFSRDNAGAETTLGTAITVSATTQYELGVAISKNRSYAIYFVDNTPIGVITTNMPSSTITCSPQLTMLKSVGTTGRTFGVISMQYATIY